VTLAVPDGPSANARSTSDRGFQTDGLYAATQERWCSTSAARSTRTVASYETKRFRVSPPWDAATEPPVIEMALPLLPPFAARPLAPITRLTGATGR
jgi:hypothetical protein